MRRAFWIVGATVVLLGILGGAPALVPASWWGSWLSGPLSSSLGQKVNLQRAWVWPWAGIWLEDLQVEGGPDDLALRLKRAHVTFRPWTWWDGTLRVDQVATSGLVLTTPLPTEADGPETKAPDEPQAPQTVSEAAFSLPISVQLASLRIDDVQWEGKSGTLRWRADLPRFRASAGAGGSQASAVLFVPSLGLAWSGLPGVSADGGVNAAESGRIQVALTATATLDGRLLQWVRRGEAKLRLSGQVGRRWALVSGQAELDVDASRVQTQWEVERSPHTLRLSLSGQGLRRLLTQRLGLAGTTWADRLGLKPSNEVPSARLDAHGRAVLDALPIAGLQGRGVVEMDSVEAKLDPDGQVGWRGDLSARAVSLTAFGSQVEGLNGTLRTLRQREEPTQVQVQAGFERVASAGSECSQGELRAVAELPQWIPSGGQAQLALRCSGMVGPGMLAQSVELSAGWKGEDFLLPTRAHTTFSATVADVRAPGFAWSGAGLRLQADLQPVEPSPSRSVPGSADAGANSVDTSALSASPDETARLRLWIHAKSLNGDDGLQIQRGFVRTEAKVKNLFASNDIQGTWAGRLEASKLAWAPGEELRELQGEWTLDGQGFLPAQPERDDPVGYGPRRGTLRLQLQSQGLRAVGASWGPVDLQVDVRKATIWSGQVELALQDEGQLLVQSEGLRFGVRGVSGQLASRLSLRHLDRWSDRTRTLGAPPARGDVQARLSTRLQEFTFDAPLDGVTAAQLHVEPSGLGADLDPATGLDGASGHVSIRYRPGGVEAEGELFARKARAGGASLSRLGLSLQGQADGRSLQTDAQLTVGAARWGDHDSQELRLGLRAQVDPSGAVLKGLHLRAPWDGVDFSISGAVVPMDGVPGRGRLDAELRLPAMLLERVAAVQAPEGTLSMRLRLDESDNGNAHVQGELRTEDVRLAGYGTELEGLTGRFPFAQDLGLSPVAEPIRFEGRVPELLDWSERLTAWAERWATAKLRLKRGNILVQAPRSADYDTLRPFQQSPPAPTLRADSLRVSQTVARDVEMDARWDSGLFSVERLAFSLWQGDALLDFAVQLTPDPNLRTRLRGTLTQLNLDIPDAQVTGREPNREVPNPFTTSAVVDLRFDLADRTVDGTADLLRVTEPMLERAFGAFELESARQALVWLRRAERIGIRPERGKIWIRNNLLSAEFDWSRLWVHVAYESPKPWDILLDTILIPGRLATIPIAGGPVINIVNSAVRRFSIGGLVDRYAQDYGAGGLLEATGAFTTADPVADPNAGAPPVALPR